MKRSIILLLVPCVLLGCGGGPPADSGSASQADEQPLLVVDTPEPLEIPARREITANDDWEAKAHNKEIEVLEVINVINPVAAYITEGFKLHGDSFSETLHEEWVDTQEQLGRAMTLYDSCKERKANGQYDKQLFLDLEEVWQHLVKTGVAGVRAKNMVDSELGRLKG
ncbi:MAG: hypothetical protein GY906_14305 [bacterium]|nr:hypothetical protein [bacterium]